MHPDKKSGRPPHQLARGLWYVTLAISMASHGIAGYMRVSRNRSRSRTNTCKLPLRPFPRDERIRAGDRTATHRWIMEAPRSQVRITAGRVYLRPLEIRTGSPRAGRGRSTQVPITCPVLHKDWGT